jgi:hypothetical protein
LKRSGSGRPFLASDARRALRVLANLQVVPRAGRDPRLAFGGEKAVVPARPH